MFVRFASSSQDLDGDAYPVKSFPEVEEAIRALDGVENTLVILGGKRPVPHMAIGGGKENRYVAYITYDEDSFQTLVNSRKPARETITVFAGEEEADFKIHQITPLDIVLKAAEYFCEHGKHDPKLLWEEAQ
jgi:hypothetical protein